MFQSIAQIYMSVPNVIAARDFYCRLLELPFDPSQEIPGEFSLIRVGEVEFCFHLGDAKNPLSMGGSIPYWRVGDFTGFIERAKSFGCEMYRGPIPIPDTDRQMGQLKDPMGLVFGIEG